MKGTISTFAAVFMFVTTVALSSAHATTAQGTSKKPVDVTGCLQPGPTAKEYLLRTADGTMWGINETDMLLNNYVDREVTISGDAMHPTASERAAGGAHHYLRAMDLVVENEHCQK